MTSISSSIQGQWTVWRLVFLLALVSRCLGDWDLAYCSTQNTGMYFQAVYNQYQSNGACHDTCTGRYAMAVLQGYECWCSDYAPSETVSTSSCDVSCPGYGAEWCGNASAGLFAYILIDGATPWGTAGAASSTVAASSASSSLVSTLPSSSGASIPKPPTSSAGSSLILTTSKQSSRISSTVIVPSSTIRETSSEPAPSSSLASSATVASSSSSSSSLKSSVPVSSPAPTTATPTEIYTSIITVTGVVRTILVTPTSPPDSTLGSSSSAGGGGGGVRPGTVVGIVVGVALGLGILIGLGVWYWLRRKHQRATEVDSLDRTSTGGGNNGVPSRQVSQLSSAGLLSKGALLATAGLPSGGGPKSAQSSTFNRQSLGTDQRLNPYAIYAQEESRNSNVSLQDNQDYSRQLRVANPDP